MSKHTMNSSATVYLLVCVMYTHRLHSQTVQCNEQNMGNPDAMLISFRGRWKEEDVGSGLKD